MKLLSEKLENLQKQLKEKKTADEESEYERLGGT